MQQISADFPDGHPRRWAILGVLVTSLLVVVLDNTILNVALKTIQVSLSATQSELVWAINSYIVVFAALLFTWGVLGDRYGRKRILVIGLLLFGVASALSAFAASPTQLIVFRGLMGIGAAAVLPVTLAIITVIFPSSERGRAVGLWAGAAGAAIAIGPILGGFLLEHFWWGSVFLVNVPVVILGVAGILALVPETRDPTPRIDPIGVPISIVGLLMLVYGIVHGGDTRDWSSPGVLGWIVAGIVVLAVFVVYEIRRHPSLDTALFRNADFSVALTAVSLTFFGLMGINVLSRVLPASCPRLVATAGGAVQHSCRGGSADVCPVQLHAGGAIRRSHRHDIRAHARRHGIRAVAIHRGRDPAVDLLVTYALIGLGMGATVAPATTRILPPHRAGAGSAVQNTMRQVGGALESPSSDRCCRRCMATRCWPSRCCPHQLHRQRPTRSARPTRSQRSWYEKVFLPRAEDADRRRQRAFIDAMNVVTIIVIAVLVTAAAVVFFLPRHADPGPEREPDVHEAATQEPRHDDASDRTGAARAATRAPAQQVADRAIVEATLELMADVGMSALTIEQVAAAAGRQGDDLPALGQRDDGPSSMRSPR